jgi:hypothetical protein
MNNTESLISKHLEILEKNRFIKNNFNEKNSKLTLRKIHRMKLINRLENEFKEYNTKKIQIIYGKNEKDNEL